MTFAEITKGVFKACRLTYSAVENKLALIRDYRSKATTQDEEYRWADLVIRTRWCRAWLGTEPKGGIDNGLSNLINEAIYHSTGAYEDELIVNNLRTPISFTAEPCELCRTLEPGFTPDDGILRDLGRDWKERYELILQALVTDSYKIMGAGNYWYAKINELRPTLTGQTVTGVDWALPLSYWDLGMERSRNFLYYGRNCFSETESLTRVLLKNLQQTRKDETRLIDAVKFIEADEYSLQAQGGLFAINTELLCEACKLTVEPDPVEISIR